MEEATNDEMCLDLMQWVPHDVPALQNEAAHSLDISQCSTNIKKRNTIFNLSNAVWFAKIRLFGSNGQTIVSCIIEQVRRMLQLLYDKCSICESDKHW